ncbi:serine protease HTRA2, mitochondrial isoform X1 [Cimex lectularius]|uniref:Serine protease HTRA2, mitochondrial n=2 Tax=Cimex lectularius TaxID=79782 RepID=A0A8I6SM13_CIMLE|nr:serine protease HTRA2, mitochondrial isoform X1 [Cimex lectularius]
MLKSSNLKRLWRLTSRQNAWSASWRAVLGGPWHGPGRKAEPQNEGRHSGTLGWGVAVVLGYLLWKERSRTLNVQASSKRDHYNFIADVVEKTAGSVVNIEIMDKRRLDFFTGSFVPRANGSGFIVKEDGLILTNAHVVMGRESGEVNVKLHDGSVYKGVVEDVDMKGDLATVRINAKQKLPVLSMGSSSKIRPGEWVVAMGSPLSLSNTVTTGVVSTVQRKSSELKIVGKEMDYIQTDAAITFGNSGGPLVNLDGQVIGINSMKVTAGISFAIPIDYAKDFLQQCEDRKKGLLPKGTQNPRRYMGITMLSLTPSIIAEMRARNKPIPEEITSGVLVWKVVIGSPAHIAGLIPGDIVVELNSENVVGASTIYKALETSSILTMKAYRGGRYHVFRVVPEVSGSLWGESTALSGRC